MSLGHSDVPQTQRCLTTMMQECPHDAKLSLDDIGVTRTQVSQGVHTEDTQANTKKCTVIRGVLHHFTTK